MLRVDRRSGDASWKLAILDVDSTSVSEQGLQSQASAEPGNETVIGHAIVDAGNRKYLVTRATVIPTMPQMITASSHGETPEIARKFAPSEAPRSASPKGISTADANQVTRTIAVIRLGPTNAHFH